MKNMQLLRIIKMKKKKISGNQTYGQVCFKTKSAFVFSMSNKNLKFHRSI